MKTPYRALVTGGAGFIGSTLVDRLLAEGHTVDVVDNLSTGSLANVAEARLSGTGQFHFHQLDVRSPDLAGLMARRQPDVVYHLAAQADVRVSVADPVLDADINVLGSLRVLEAARAAGARKVVFASSGGTIYGDVEQLPVKESQPQRPLSPYGVAKKAVGDYLFAYRELHGLEYTALALANVYGAARTCGAKPAWWPYLPGGCFPGSPASSSGTGSRRGILSSWTTWSTLFPGPESGAPGFYAISVRGSKPRSTSCTRPWPAMPVSTNRLCMLPPAPGSCSAAVSTRAEQPFISAGSRGPRSTKGRRPCWTGPASGLRHPDPTSRDAGAVI